MTTALREWIREQDVREKLFPSATAARRFPGRRNDPREMKPALRVRNADRDGEVYPPFAAPPPVRYTGDAAVKPRFVADHVRRMQFWFRIRQSVKRAARGLFLPASAWLHRPFAW